MPKVSDDYLAKKRNQILDAAFSVCMRKPMHTVSMRDIISESGLSQGNIYRYFSNLDDVLVELINRESAYYDVKTLADATVTSGDVPEKVICEIFSIWGKAVLDNLVGFGKIFFEMLAVLVNDEERLHRFYSQVHFMSKEAYLQEKTFNYISQMTREGYFEPKLQIDEIFTFLAAAFDGIIRDLIISQHYQFSSVPFSFMFEKEKLLKSLCIALVLLLGGNEKLIFKEGSL